LVVDRLVGRAAHHHVSGRSWRGLLRERALAGRGLFVTCREIRSTDVRAAAQQAEYGRGQAQVLVDEMHT
jgi:hypothetical protein